MRWNILKLLLVLYLERRKAYGKTALDVKYVVSEISDQKVPRVNLILSNEI
jgi:hypothetical protein